MLCVLNFVVFLIDCLEIILKIIAFITFLHDIITFQKNIYGTKIPYMQAKFKCNTDCILCLKAVYLFPFSSKPDLTLSSMDRDAGNINIF
jgi:hypothetical protein